MRVAAQPCPANQVPNERGDGCICNDGFYNASQKRLHCYAESESFSEADFAAVLEPDAANAHCQSCTEQLAACISCAGGSATMKNGTSVSQMAKKLALGVVGTTLTGPLALFRCPMLAGCLGQRAATDNATAALCDTGYTGALCAVCDKPAGFVKSDLVCQQCTSGSSLKIFGFIVGLVCALVIAKRYTEAIRSRIADSGISVVQAKILIGLMQVVTQLPVVLEIRYPEAFTRLLGALGVVLLDVFEILRIDCITPMSLHAKFGIIMLLPVAAISIVLLFRCWKDARGSGESSVKASNRAAAANQAFVIIFLLYPLLSRYLCIPSRPDSVAFPQHCTAT